MGDRPRQWLVALGVIVLFASLFANFYQQRMNGEQAAADHAQNAQQQQEILAALHNHTDEIKSIQATAAETQALESQVSGFVDQIHTEIPQFAAGLTAGQNTLIGQYNTIIAKQNEICAVLHACGFTAPAPTVSVPVSGAPATITPHPSSGTPTTTTTTAPKHGKGRR